MIEHIKEVLTSEWVLAKGLMFSLFSVTFGILGTVFNPKNRTVVAYLFSTLAAPPIGILAGFFATERGYSDSVVLIVVAVTSVLAQDIIRFVLSFGSFMTENSTKVFEHYLDKFLKKVKKPIDKDK